MQGTAQQPPELGTRPIGQSQQMAGRLWRLVLKELREIFRDRRTIVTLIVMPLLIYPLLALVFQRFLLTSLTSHESLYVVEVETELDKNLLEQQLKAGQAILERRERDGPRDEENLPAIHWRYGHSYNISRDVASSEAHLGIVSQRTGGATSKLGLTSSVIWELIYRPGTTASVDALHFIEARLQALIDSQLDEQLRKLQVTVVQPAAISRSPISFAGAPVFSLAALIPLILVLTTVTGAVYPAIDLTAGERERGTMEMLIAAPVPRLGLLLAKYVAVLAVALMTAVVNLAGMTITAQSTGLSAMLFGERGMSLEVIIKVWLLLGLFAAFFSAVLLAITSYARSFKEAQAYIIPLMLICLVPGIVCLLPGLEFSGPMAVTPLVNIVMLARDMLEGDVSPGLAAAAVLSTGLYVAAAIAVAARIFGTDAVLYGSPSTWADVFRRPTERLTAVSPSAALFALALMFPLYFVSAGILAQTYSITSHDPARQLAERLVMGGLVTLLVFTAIPAAVAMFHRVRPATGLGLTWPSPIAVFAAIILGLSLWPFAHEIVLFGHWLGIGELDIERLTNVGQFAEMLRDMPLPLLLVTLAIVPGICEEFFFRGLLFGALQQRLSGWGTVAVTAILFGLFHVIVGNMFAPERFLPSAFLGFVLGWVRWKCGSVLPTMLLHSIHNGLLIYVTHRQTWLVGQGIGDEARIHLPLLWLFAAVVATAAGVAMIYWSASRQSVERIATS